MYVRTCVCVRVRVRTCMCVSVIYLPSVIAHVCEYVPHLLTSRQVLLMQAKVFAPIASPCLLGLGYSVAIAAAYRCAYRKHDECRTHTGTYCNLLLCMEWKAC